MKSSNHQVGIALCVIVGIAAPPAASQQPKPSKKTNAIFPVDFCYSKGKVIFVQKAGQQQSEQWISNKNASYPSLSPAGDTIAFTMSTESKTQLLLRVPHETNIGPIPSSRSKYQYAVENPYF